MVNYRAQEVLSATIGKHSLKIMGLDALSDMVLPDAMMHVTDGFVKW